MSQPQHPSPSQLILHRALLSNRTPQFPWQLPHVVSALEAEGRRAADRRYVALQSPTLPVPCRPSCLSPSPPGSPAEATQSPQGKKRRDSGTKAARSLPQNVSLTCVILRYCPVGQHFVVFWSLQGEAREDPEQDHTFSCVSSFLPVQWGWHLVLGPGFKFLLCCFKPCNLSETVSSLYRGMGTSASRCCHGKANEPPFGKVLCERINP